MEKRWRRLPGATTATAIATHRSTATMTYACDVWCKFRMELLQVAHALVDGRALLGVLMPRALDHGFECIGEIGGKVFALAGPGSFIEMISQETKPKAYTSDARLYSGFILKSSGAM